MVKNFSKPDLKRDIRTQRVQDLGIAAAVPQHASQRRKPPMNPPPTSPPTRPLPRTPSSKTDCIGSIPLQGCRRQGISQDCRLGVSERDHDLRESAVKEEEPYLKILKEYGMGPQPPEVPTLAPTKFSTAPSAFSAELPPRWTAGESPCEQEGPHLECTRMRPQYFGQDLQSQEPTDQKVRVEPNEEARSKLNSSENFWSGRKKRVRSARCEAILRVSSLLAIRRRH